MTTQGDQPIEALPRLKPGERHPQLEVDVFCVTCGYNLHGQPVTRDDRLGIFICRCPECGRFHPAGTGLTAAQPWMNMLATALLVFWVFFVLFVTFWLGMGMGAVTTVYVDTFTDRKFVTANGEPAEWKVLGNGGWQVVRKGTTRPINGYRMVYTLERQPPDSTPWNRGNNQPPTWRARATILGGAIAISLLAGALLGVFLWHWRRRSYRFTLLFPFLIAGIFIFNTALDDAYSEIIGWAIRTALGFALMDAICMAIGLKIGRPIARTFLRMFVPPKPRQHFAFLWHADGKSPPPATPTPMSGGTQ